MLIQWPKKIVWSGDQEQASDCQKCSRVKNASPYIEASPTLNNFPQKEVVESTSIVGTIDAMNLRKTTR